MIVELTPIYDSATSFYNKAVVKTENRVKTLYSYGVEVAVIEGKQAKINGWFSATTARHINEFLKQSCFKKLTKKQMLTKPTITD